MGRVVSEKLSDLIEPSIKYGGGNDKVKQLLASASQLIIQQERNESAVLRIETQFAELEPRRLTDEELNEVENLKQQASRLHNQMLDVRRKRLEVLSKGLAILEASKDHGS